MSCTSHGDHTHKHGAGCGHKAINHEGHVDYLHDNHMHHVHGDHVDCHKISDSEANKSACTPEHKCQGHDNEHKHGAECGHEAVPHGDHTCYIVEGHLHRPCGTHCDHHGEVSLA